MLLFIFIIFFSSSLHLNSLGVSSGIGNLEPLMVHDDVIMGKNSSLPTEVKNDLLKLYQYLIIKIIINKYPNFIVRILDLKDDLINSPIDFDRLSKLVERFDDKADSITEKQYTLLRSTGLICICDYLSLNELTTIKDFWLTIQRVETTDTDGELQILIETIKEGYHAEKPEETVFEYKPPERSSGASPSKYPLAYISENSDKTKFQILMERVQALTKEVDHLLTTTQNIRVLVSNIEPDQATDNIQHRKKLETSTENLHTRIFEMKKFLEDLNLQMKQYDTHEASQMTQRIEAITQSHLEFEQYLEQREKELQEVTKEHQTLQERFSKREIEYQRVQQELEKTTQQHHTTTCQVTTLQQTVKQERRDFEEAFKEMQDQNEEKNKEIEQLQKEVTRLQGKLKESQDLQKEFVIEREQRETELNQEVEQLKTALAEKAKKDPSETRLHGQKREFKQLKEENTQLRDKVHRLAGKVRELNEKLRQYDPQIEGLKEESRSLKAQHQEIARRLSQSLQGVSLQTTRQGSTLEDLSESTEFDTKNLEKIVDLTIQEREGIVRVLQDTVWKLKYLQQYSQVKVRHKSGQDATPVGNLSEHLKDIEKVIRILTPRSKLLFVKPGIQVRELLCIRDC